jgi:hypothetical protein
MPAGNKSISIDKYALYHSACGNLATNYIVCYNAGSVQGQICFYPKGQVLASTVSSTGFFSLGYEIDRFHDIITTLRYEKPIYIILFWDANNVITTGYVSTSLEPIGEQEGV